METITLEEALDLFKLPRKVGEFEDKDVYKRQDYDQAINAYKQVVQKYPGSDEARLAMRDLKSIYVDMNRIDEFAALASAMPGNIRFDASEQDSLTYMAAEKIYIRGRVEQAKESFGKYLQTCLLYTSKMSLLYHNL